MPRAITDGTTDQRATRALGRRHPIARVDRTRIAHVAVVGTIDVTDEVVPRKDSPGKIGVIEDTGVDNRDHLRGEPGGDVPGGRRIDAFGLAEIPLFRIAGIVGHQRGKGEAVGDDVEDLGVFGQPCGNRLNFVHGQTTAEPDDMTAITHGSHGHKGFGGEQLQPPGDLLAMGRLLIK